ARKSGPNDAVKIDVDAARAVSPIRWKEDFSQRGLRRVRPRYQVDQIIGLIEASEADIHGLAPDGVVDGAGLDCIESRPDPRVLVRIEGLTRLRPLVSFAIAVGVDDDRRPALRFRLVAGLLIHLGIEPADRAAMRLALAEPQRVIGVMREVQVVGIETGV